MNSTAHYKAWAPEESLWSDWAKPILFAQGGPGSWLPVPDWRRSNIAWAPGVDSGMAIILDLDEAYSVWMGLALAQRGYRPVPLFNGVPGFAPLIGVEQIVNALRVAAADLQNISIAPSAPPVFLLDARRSGGGSVAGPGRFDNRWAVFPQDFPSANFLLANGIRSVVVGQSSWDPPQRDLAHVLLRWQESGIGILHCDVRGEERPQPITVTRPGHFRTLWYRALVLAGLRRNSAGGFGAVVPEPTQSSGWG